MSVTAERRTALVNDYATGKDDTGKPLESKMPRFSATPEDTAALWAYVLTLK